MTKDSVLEEIKNRLDIVDLISQYVELKRAGQNFRGLCPFHSEKTPSFMVSRSKQIYHCFGCGEGGDIFSFLIEHESMTFSEALKVLAERAGVKLSPRHIVDKDRRDILKEIHITAVEFFRENLAHSKEASTYLKNRGVRADSIKTFSLGYAKNSWHSLYEHLRAKGFEEALIIKSGLVATGSKGIYDIFRDRIMFPIFDLSGEPIAFGARVMDNSLPKYLNSPDTELFKKGQTLYGLNMAEDDIRKNDYALIVEGYLDVIACHQAGFKNVVAPLGTALTEGHIKRLLRYTKNLILVFDGDSAGVLAAKRSLPIIFEHELRAKVLLLPDGHDPDSLLKEKDGSSKFSKLIENSSTPIEFILKKSNAPKVDRVKDALSLIGKVKDTILREELILELSERSGVRESALRDALRRPQIERTNLLKGSDEIKKREETILLNIMLSMPEMAGLVACSVSPDEVENPLLRRALIAVGSGSTIESLFDTDDEKEKAVLRRLSIEMKFDPSAVEKNIKDCTKKIKLRSIEAKIKEARSKGDLRAIDMLVKERKNLLQGGPCNGF